MRTRHPDGAFVMNQARTVAGEARRVDVKFVCRDIRESRAT